MEKHQTIVQSLVGKTVPNATAILSKYGIAVTGVENNFIKPINGSTLLVMSAKINGSSATLIVGSFKLDI